MMHYQSVLLASWCSQQVLGRGVSFGKSDKSGLCIHTFSQITEAALKGATRGVQKVPSLTKKELCYSSYIKSVSFSDIFTLNNNPRLWKRQLFWGSTGKKHKNQIKTYCTVEDFYQLPQQSSPFQEMMQEVSEKN